MFWFNGKLEYPKSRASLIVQITDRTAYSLESWGIKEILLKSWRQQILLRYKILENCHIMISRYYDQYKTGTCRYLWNSWNKFEFFFKNFTVLTLQEILSDKLLFFILHWDFSKFYKQFTIFAN